MYVSAHCGFSTAEILPTPRIHRHIVKFLVTAGARYPYRTGALGRAGQARKSEHTHGSGDVARQ